MYRYVARYVLYNYSAMGFMLQRASSSGRIYESYVRIVWGVATWWFSGAVWLDPALIDKS